MVNPNGSGRWSIIADMANDREWTMGAELGVLFGLLYFRLLDRCPQLTLVGVDIWEHQPDQEALRDEGGRSYETHDLSEYESRVRRKAKPYGSRAVLHKMRTVDAAKLYPDGHFDFVFIDADHLYEGVKADIEAWRPKIKEGGCI